MKSDDFEDEDDTHVHVLSDEDDSNGFDSGESEVTKLKAENEELKKERLYLKADFDNYRKQAIKERSELVKYGSEPIIREFLGVLDNLERAAATELNAETMANYKNGVDLIVSQFQSVIEKLGVEGFGTPGQSFDPSLHEALSSESNPDLPANSVSQVFKKGYKLKGKIIRPAQVVVNTLKA